MHFSLRISSIICECALVFAHALYHHQGDVLYLLLRLFVWRKETDSPFGMRNKQTANVWIRARASCFTLFQSAMHGETAGCVEYKWMQKMIFCENCPTNGEGNQKKEEIN